MYVGLDVHKDFCQAAFVNAKGKAVKERVFENNSVGLADLAKLAQLLRADLIPESFVPCVTHRQARLLVRHRASLVWARARIKNQIQSLLTKEGIKIDEPFGKKGLLFLKTMDIGEIQRISLDTMLFLLEAFNMKIKEADGQIEALRRTMHTQSFLSRYPA